MVRAQLKAQLPGFTHRLAAATRATGGVTADITRLSITPVHDSWHFPRYPELTRILPLEDLAGSILAFVQEHQDLFDGEVIQFGAWINPATQLCYLDLITRSSSRDEALELARKYGVQGGRQVVAIYNPVRELTEWLGEG
ncbi:hypothetical protein OG474_25900 [Kribbella sp. NBC_01505]|uniref:hypothetical protein n=1 Tax=Kribbella sp. NBC_01505 TaxID=2903580 RepID=UPI0038666E66